MSDPRKYSVFVRNLDSTTTDTDFVSYFQRKYANAVIGGVIVRDSNGRSKGYGFINLIDPSNVKTVLSAKNHVLNGRKLVCKIAHQKKKHRNLPKNFQKKEPKYLRELYVGNLNVTTTNQQLKEYFQKFGSIITAYIALDGHKRSKGYGFVEFENSSSVTQVQEERPHKINNKEVQTVRSYPKNVPKHLKSAATILFVLNYNEDVDEENIEEYFSEFGNITLVSRKVDRSKDIKFMELEFDDYDAVDVICLADSHTINGCTVTVTKCLDGNLEKLSNTQTEKQNAARPAANSIPNATNSRDARNWTPRAIQPKPSAPSLPLHDLHQAPFNPHFVNEQQQHQQQFPSLYPSLPQAPANPQPVSRSINIGPPSRRSPPRNRPDRTNNGCLIS